MTAKSENSASSVPISGTMNRRRRYQEGSLLQERRKQCSHARFKHCPHCVWVYRFFAHIDGKKIRRKVILGTGEQFPTKDDAKRASEHFRMSANSENPRPNITMQALIDLYTERILKKCLDVPIGGTEDPDAKMGYACANNYRWHLRNRIAPHWNKYAVSDFERPEIWSAAEDWLESLKRSANNPKGLAPKSVRLIFAVMGQLMRYAVKWGYLAQNPFAGKAGQGRKIDPPRGSTLRLNRAAQLTPGQVFQLLPHLSLVARVAVTLAAWLGPRGSESFGLKWGDLDLNAKVIRFRRGLVLARITKGKTAASRTESPLPDEVVQLLCEWQSVTPYNKPGDWLFASGAQKGKMPLSRYALMREHIQPVALKLGLPHISWYSFRHSLSAWGKECLTAEERKAMLRHGSIRSGEDYGEIPLEKKHEIGERLWAYVRLAARQSLDAAPNQYPKFPNGTTENGKRVLSREPGQSPSIEPETVAFDHRAANHPLHQHDVAIASEHERRSAAAGKAWETIRANKAKKAAGTGNSDPCLTRINNKKLA